MHWRRSKRRHKISSAQAARKALFVEPDWPAPSRVRAVSTTRCGGFGNGPFASFNLAAHTGDDPASVAANRQHLCELLKLPSEPKWLRQEHGATVVDAAAVTEPVAADASFTNRPGVVCAILTADCLPVLLCDRAGSRIAASHAGWRGLVAGVLPATVNALGSEPGELLAWLGPAIGQQAFEVGPEVRATFLGLDPGNTDYFVPSPAGRWLADIAGIAERQLRALGVSGIHGSRICSYQDAERFFSFRRNRNTGRMASLLWLARDEAAAEQRLIWPGPPQYKKHH